MSCHKASDLWLHWQWLTRKCLLHTHWEGSFPALLCQPVPATHRYYIEHKHNSPTCSTLCTAAVYQFTVLRMPQRNYEATLKCFASYSFFFKTDKDIRMKQNRYQHRSLFYHGAYLLINITVHTFLPTLKWFCDSVTIHLCVLRI